MKAAQTWYVVMNSNRARILRDLPGTHDPLPAEITMQGRRASMADIIEDRPTRSFASAGGGRRSAVEPGSNPLEEDSRAFLHDLQDFLTRAAATSSFDWLVVVASPDAMGMWRAQIPPDLKSRVKKEFVLNLVSFSARELVAALRALIEP
ncbi:host attachment protein [Roseovarius sp.]|uniref:host attachment protein n=1 Tax=Roseovarius sp. TaxID=1486281 RepID=UPI003A97A8B7